ncbi:MAG TPA: M1 family metallopeptidase, partial [Gemmata sp.]|nr:M1 family metallopeptidase [Gemmata sp.]
TNTTRTPANHLAFNFYPNYRVPRGDYLPLAKTLEMLRLQPSFGIERLGRIGAIKEARLIAAGGVPDVVLPFEFDESNPTALRFPLPRPVDPGQSVTVELVCEYHLPNKQGRLGYWEGVTYITNSFPVLAFCDDTGWRPMPFVPWHQPWFNEAGIFHATITLPEKEILACPAKTKSETLLGNGRKRVETEEFVGRDFAVLCSARFQEFTAETKLPSGKTVALRCLAFAEHEWYAREILTIVAEAIPIYSQWFGDFPYDTFTVAESYFGWNGNECGGLIMIDERVFAMPHLARGYVEYLVSHETSHQWWYNLVGTNGYSEPFMDEGSAAYFTHRLLDKKRGKNNEFMQWPRGFGWMPNITRENYHWSGTYFEIRNGYMFPAAQDLPRYGHLFHLFTGAYDRGSKALGMIESQLGEAAFLDFTRLIVAKYGWRVLQIADYRRELEEYTQRDWGEFFDRWIFGKGLTDWKLESVSIDREAPFLARQIPLAAPAARNRVTVTMRQKGEYAEPTTLGVRFKDGKGFPLRIPITPGMGAMTGRPSEVDGLPRDLEYTVEPGADGVLKVSFTMMGEPDQIAIDPDHVLLDANPYDNYWKPSARVRLTPFYTMIDETDITSDYDRWNLTAGPWIWGPSYLDPWYTRSTMIGLRVGANKPQRFRAGAYAAFRSDYRDLIAGVDAVILGDHLEYGFNWEKRIGGPWAGQAGAGGPNRAAVYARQILKPGSSLYLPAVMYQDGFATYQDNFLPFVRNPGGERWDRLAMA